MKRPFLRVVLRCEKVLTSGEGVKCANCCVYHAIELLPNSPVGSRGVFGRADEVDRVGENLAL